MTLLTQSQSDYCAEYSREEKLFASNVQQFKPRRINWGFAGGIAFCLAAWFLFFASIPLLMAAVEHWRAV